MTNKEKLVSATFIFIGLFCMLVAGLLVGLTFYSVDANSKGMLLIGLCCGIVGSGGLSLVVSSVADFIKRMIKARAYN